MEYNLTPDRGMEGPAIWLTGEARMDFDDYIRGRRTESARRLDDDFAGAVHSLVSEIPRGKVLTYGDIARLIGAPRNARLVGKVMSRAELFGRFPCHRVVNSAGRTAASFPEQAERLLGEGVPFRKNGTVDLAKCRCEEAFS